MKNIVRSLIIIVAVCVLNIHNSQAQQKSFIPGEVWKDNNGSIINAHSAGIMKYNGVYYMYGEIKKGTTWLVTDLSWECFRVSAGGVSCYSSKDLINWKYEGVALSSTAGNTGYDLDTSRVIERPKVFYNKNTCKFVMWMHIDTKDYMYARCGVAVSDKPTGPFTYLNSVRPNGNMARDMTIFQDDDGKAYHFYSSEDNKTMHIALLANNYLSHTTTEKRILINQSREAPVVFKHNKKYYLITSGCTGWSPNPASYSVADNILGDWVQYDNPCTGKDADLTFLSQGTFVIPLDNKKDAFIFLADRWNKTNLEDSRYVWLPMTIKEGRPVIQWKYNWNFSFFD